MKPSSSATLLKSCGQTPSGSTMQPLGRFVGDQPSSRQVSKSALKSASACLRFFGSSFVDKSACSLIILFLKLDEKLVSDCSNRDILRRFSSNFGRTRRQSASPFSPKFVAHFPAHAPANFRACNPYKSWCDNFSLSAAQRAFPNLSFGQTARRLKS